MMVPHVVRLKNADFCLRASHSKGKSHASENKQAQSSNASVSVSLTAQEETRKSTATARRKADYQVHFETALCWNRIPMRDTESC